MTPAGVLTLAAGAGVLRWVVMAATADVLALALVQPLHGLTFAALHLACMRLLAAIVPRRLAATAGWNRTGGGAIQRRYRLAPSSSQGTVRTVPE